jgi:hypothetical protein
VAVRILSCARQAIFAYGEQNIANLNMEEGDEKQNVQQTEGVKG